jgi:hypothetical protein
MFADYKARRFATSGLGYREIVVYWLSDLVCCIDISVLGGTLAYW